MNPEELFARYLRKYQIDLQHPDHGQITLTSAVWPQQPALRQTVQAALMGLDGVQTATPVNADQLDLRYDSAQLRRLNPLKLLALERQIGRQYRQAGY
ncbi:hypothetical protein [Levilactobacillus acidifarinae]|nr:hypothetical protein [Levilactobacillus acidifarinae]GEO70332.1 hypothetical protein LAC03_22420 [Levilactobacillus acidifarinae]